MPYYGRMLLDKGEAPRIFHQNDGITFGKNVVVEPWVFLDASGGKVFIDDNSIVQTGAIVRTTEVTKVKPGKNDAGVEYDYTVGDIRIGKNCIVGAYAMIGPKSVLPDGTIVPPYSRYAQTPQPAKASVKLE